VVPVKCDFSHLEKHATLNHDNKCNGGTKRRFLLFISTISVPPSQRVMYENSSSSEQSKNDLDVALVEVEPYIEDGFLGMLPCCVVRVCIVL
jgi:hypothetical protein